MKLIILTLSVSISFTLGVFMAVERPQEAAKFTTFINGFLPKEKNFYR